MVWVTSESACKAQKKAQVKRNTRRIRSNYLSQIFHWGIFLFCLLCFVVNSYKNMSKFMDAATVVSEEWVWSHDKTLALPTITLCPIRNSKTKETFDTPRIEDIHASVHRSRGPDAYVNFSEHRVTNTRFRGQCWTKDLPELGLNQLLTLVLNPSPFRIFFHEKGEEFFLHWGWFPAGLPQFMNTHSLDEPLYSVYLTKTQIEEQDNCNIWTVHDQIECIRSNLRARYAESGVNCTKSWLNDLLEPNPPSAEECETNKQLDFVSEVLYYLVLEICQRPCKRVKYGLKVDNFGQDEENEQEKVILMQYETTATRVMRAMPLSDFNDFVSSVGGSLGLFLDFSLISIIYALAKRIKAGKK